MAGHKKVIFILINVFLLIVVTVSIYQRSLIAIIYFFYELSHPKEGIIANQGNLIELLRLIGTYFCFCILPLGTNIMTAIIAIVNLKRKHISHKIRMIIKIDSWLCVLLVIMYVVSDMFRIFALFYLIKLIILRVFASRLFYSEYGRKKIKDANKSDEVK